MSVAFLSTMLICGNCTSTTSRPPSFQSEEVSSTPSDEAARAELPKTALESHSPMNVDCSEAFRSLLGEALLAACAVSSEHGHKRPGLHCQDDGDDGPVAKKAKSLIPRIAYYPRIMVGSTVAIAHFFAYSMVLTRSASFFFFRP